MITAEADQKVKFQKKGRHCEEERRSNLTY